MAPERVLVVGATRILRPAALALAAAGNRVHVLARTATDLGELSATDPEHLAPLAVDYTDDDAFAARLSEHRFDHAVAYCPRITTASLSALRDSVDGASVHLLPSSAARPAAVPDEPFDVSRLGAAPAPWHRLVLGWTPGPQRRWHTPEEISAAALDVLSAREDRVLGVVRPWDDRPS